MKKGGSQCAGLHIQTTTATARSCSPMLPSPLGAKDEIGGDGKKITPNGRDSQDKRGKRHSFFPTLPQRRQRSGHDPSVVTDTAAVTTPPPSPDRSPLSSNRTRRPWLHKPQWFCNRLSMHCQEIEHGNLPPSLTTTEAWDTQSIAPTLHPDVESVNSKTAPSSATTANFEEDLLTLDTTKPPRLRRRSSAPSFESTEKHEDVCAFMKSAKHDKEFDKEWSSKKHYTLANVVHPKTKEPVMDFTKIPKRKKSLRHNGGTRREAKALAVWRDTLAKSIEETVLECRNRAPSIPPDKVAKYILTRKFIIREFYTTEVTFWNQLYFVKTAYYDGTVAMLAKGSPLVRQSDLDFFANLPQLMDFSSNLIRRLNCCQFARGVTTPMNLDLQSSESSPSFADVRLGKALRDLAPKLVIFLRCSIDYKTQRKLLTQRMDSRRGAEFREKMNIKEAKQFTAYDYLISPIQRVARYGLLLADLKKHTSPDDPDYKDLVLAHSIIKSLATAMNSAQK